MGNMDLELEDRLRGKDREAFKEVYISYREEFLAFGRKYGVSRNELLDIYQEANIALYRNFAVKGKKLESGTVKTYLFGIGKFKIFDLLKERKRFKQADAVPEIPQIPDYHPEPSVEVRLLRKHFGSLGESCKKILKMFYYRGLAIAEIVEQGNYKDANTVKAQKSRCLKKLRESIKSRTGKNG